MIYHEKDIEFEAILESNIIISDKYLYHDIFNIKENTISVRRISSYDIIINYEPLTNARFQYA